MGLGSLKRFTAAVGGAVAAASGSSSGSGEADVGSAESTTRAVGEGAGPPAWFGKLPALGDFASRRMPSGVLQAWDDWLSAGLADWKARDPHGWLAGYLAAPSRRFLLVGGGAGVEAFGARPAWAGVLMPSVDAVGRYFPFTLLRPLARVPTEAVEARGLLAWLQRADDLAADALHDNWTIEALEAALASLVAAEPGWFDTPRSTVTASTPPARRGLFSSAPRAGAREAGRDEDDDDETVIGAGDDTVILGGEDDATGFAETLRALVPASARPALERRLGWVADLRGPAGAERRSTAAPMLAVWWSEPDADGETGRRIDRGLPRGPDFARLFHPRGLRDR